MPGFLALDVGDRRIGLAVAEWGDLVIPLGVVARGPSDIDAIKKHIDERFIDRVIVGLPVSLDDSIGTQAQKVLKFIEQLRAAIKIPIETYDERFTTQEAEELLLSADVSRSRRRQSIDAMAAAQILKGYLSSRTNLKDESEPG